MSLNAFSQAPFFSSTIANTPTTNPNPQASGQIFQPNLNSISAPFYKDVTFKSTFPEVTFGPTLFMRKGYHSDIVDMRIPAKKAGPKNPPAPQSPFIILMDLLINKNLPDGLEIPENIGLPAMAKARMSLSGPPSNSSKQIIDLVFSPSMTREVAELYRSKLPKGYRHQFTHFIYKALEGISQPVTFKQIKTILNLVVKDSTATSVIYRSFPKDETKECSEANFDKIIAMIPNAFRQIVYCWRILCWVRCIGMDFELGESKEYKKLASLFLQDHKSPALSACDTMISDIQNSVLSAIDVIGSIDPDTESALHDAIAYIDSAFLEFSSDFYSGEQNAQQVMTEAIDVSSLGASDIARLQLQFADPYTDPTDSDQRQTDKSIASKIADVIAQMIPSVAQPQMPAAPPNPVYQAPPSLQAPTNSSPADDFCKACNGNPDWLGENLYYNNEISLDFASVYLKYKLTQATANYLSSQNPTAANLVQYCQSADIEYWEKLGKSAALLGAYSLCCDLKY
jgi:hypothetical protein